MSPFRVQVFEVKDVDPTSPNGVIDAIRRDPKANAVFTKFEKSCAEHMQAVHDDCIKGLNKRERAWFERWWKGKHIDWKSIPKKAHSATLSACSAGCG